LRRRRRGPRAVDRRQGVRDQFLLATVRRAARRRSAFSHACGRHRRLRLDRWGARPRLRHTHSRGGLMPAVRPAQLKRIEDVLGLCKAGGGPLEAFDAAATALEPAERELALRQAGRALRQAQTRVTELTEVARGLEALQAAAAYRAIVLGVEVTNG